MTKKEIIEETLTYNKLKDTSVGKALFDAGYKSALEELEKKLPVAWNKGNRKYKTLMTEEEFGKIQYKEQVLSLIDTLIK